MSTGRMMRAIVSTSLLTVFASVGWGQTTFSNTNAITCATGVGAAAADFALGTSCTSYPSTIAVSGMAGTISNVNVRLNSVNIEREQDMIVLLVGPTGSNLILLSDAGRSTTTNTTGATLTISDSGAAVLAQEGTMATGTIRPSGHNSGLANRKDNFSSPAPAQGSLVYPAPFGSATLAGQFNGINPNGTWSLYVIDDALGPASGGTQGINVSGGWSLIITTAVASQPTSTTVGSSQNPSLTGSNVTFTATVSSAGNPVTLGSVTFFVDNVQQGGTVALGGSGQATFNTNALTEGSHVVRADDGGATGFGTSNGSMTQIVNNATTVTGTTFCNTGAINVGDNLVGVPYPSNIFVTGTSGTISNMNLQLKGFTSSRPDDFDLLLVGPGSQKFVLMSDVGTTVNPVSNLNITLDDLAGSQLPDEGALSSGTFRPTAVGTGDTFPSPAPATPHSFAAPAGSSTFANLFGGGAANGTWALYVLDYGLGGGASSIAQGWCLAFTMSSAPATTTEVTSSLNPSFTGNNVTLTATVRLVSNNSLVTQGTVTFREGATVLSGPTALNGSGQASFSTTSLAEGLHVITADYNGVAGTFNISTGAVNQTVNNQTTVSQTTYCNPGPTNLNDSGPATQYPQRIFVSGLSGVIQSMTMQLRGITTARPDDLDVLLVGPTGVKFVPMSDAGGSNAASNVTLTFDDSAGSALGDETALVTASFRPTSFNALGLNSFPSPAPSAPWSNAAPNGSATFTNLFQGTNPNGTWELFVVDDGLGGGTGSFANGYCLTFTMASDLTISKTHTGNFTQGQTGAEYSITVSNVGAAPAFGLVTVTDTLPAGLTATALSGSGWNCVLGTLTCTRNDGLAGSSAYPPITLTANVSGSAPASVTNTAAVSGGGDLNLNNNGSSDPTTIIATVNLTFNTSPAGLSYSVNGTPYTSQQILSLPVGSQVTIATTSPQGDASTRNVFQSWSDAGAISHTITVPASATTYTATFQTEHFLTTGVSPTGSGTITPASGFFAAGSSIPVTATPNGGFTFAGFTGALTGTTNPQNITLNAPASVTANFDTEQISLTFNTSPAGLSYSVNGTPYTSQQALAFPVGSQVTIATTSPQGNGSTRNVFQSWSDAGAISHIITVPASATTYTATFQTEHFLTTGVSPTGSGTITPASGFFAAGSSIPVTATPNGGFTFAGFTSALTGTTNPQNVTLNAPATVTATFNGSGATLSSLTQGKAGPIDARVWTFRLTNNGPGTAVNAGIDSISFVQQFGAACTPVVVSALPAGAGTIAPATSANATATINFSGCAANARFRVTWGFSANGGANTGSMTLFNQFQ